MPGQPGVTVAFERFEELNEDRFELPAGAGFATVVDQGHRVWLMELWVHPGRRGCGLASVLLAAVLAGYPGRVIALAAEPFRWADDEAPGLPADELASWYARHGFRPGPGDYMERPADR